MWMNKSMYKQLNFVLEIHLKTDFYSDPNKQKNQHLSTKTEVVFKNLNEFPIR